MISRLQPPEALAAGRQRIAPQLWRMQGSGFIQCWAALAGLGLLCGLSWRHQQSAPDPFILCDALGLALWCCAVLLAPGWERYWRGLLLAPNAAASRARLLIQAAGWFVTGALMLSLAAGGVLLAYNLATPAARVIALDLKEFTLPYGLLLTGVLVLLGPLQLTAATAILCLARRWLGPTLGAAAWVLIALYVHSERLLGQAAAKLPLSMGQLAETARNRLNAVNVDPSRGIYANDLVTELILLPLVLTAVAGGLLAVAQPRPREVRQRIDSGWVAALAALVCICWRAQYAAAAWVEDMARQYPGNWQVLFALATGMAMVCYSLFQWPVEPGQRNRSRWRGMAWLAGTAPLWLLATTVNIATGQLTQREALLAGALSLLLLCLWIVFIDLARDLYTWQPPAAGLLMLGLLAAALLPLGTDGIPGVGVLLYELLQAAGASERLENAAMVVGCLVLAGVLGLAAGARRPRRATAHPPSKR